MTRRERLEAVIEGNITEELVESCREELKKLTDGKEPTARQLENMEYEGAIEKFLKEKGEPTIVAEIHKECAPELERQRVTSICTNLVNAGRLKKEKIKIKGKGERVAYSLNE